MYGGNRAKWLKFANGVLAKNYMTISGKNTMYLDSAINAVDASLSSQADDATVAVAGGTVSAQVNFFGVLRGSLIGLFLVVGLRRMKRELFLLGWMII